MCGLVGVVTSRSARVSIDDDALIRMRDLLTHRGPDDAGIYRRPHVALGHRRLSVIDPTPAGHQPMIRPDGSALIYNGELYNDTDLRQQLVREFGAGFATHCDTETVLEALAHLDPTEAIARLRGMYALAYYDAQADRLVLARDPIGVKPLYYWIGRAGDSCAHTEIAFASELPALLAHPAISNAPDLATVSAYLTTIRTTLGRRTLYAGVNCVLPGEIVEFELCGAEPVITRSSPRWDHTDPPAGDLSACIEDSVHAHLRADVPLCCLLSGGIDSSVIASIAAERSSEQLRTFCAGDAATIQDSNSDFAHARLVAEQIGADHTEVPITRELFQDRWPDMIARLGLPLSTPNEVAINEVARAIRTSGAVVTLSGEGADELFAGYEAPMAAAVACVDASFAEPGLFQLASSAWAPPHSKDRLLNEDIWRLVERDEALHTHYHDEFSAIETELAESDSAASDRPLRAHLHLHQRINLPGLLQRLDTATMLESVEGRTPFADRRVAAHSRRIPMSDLYKPETSSAPAQTKIALRRAFANLPRNVVTRPKASFSLPFQEWVAESAPALRSDFATYLFNRDAINAVIADPEANWSIAWPMINIALWGQLAG